MWRSLLERLVLGGAGGDIRELTLSTDRHSWEHMTCVLRKTGVLLAEVWPLFFFWVMLLDYIHLPE